MTTEEKNEKLFQLANKLQEENLSLRVENEILNTIQINKEDFDIFIKKIQLILEILEEKLSPEKKNAMEHLFDYEEKEKKQIKKETN